MMVDHVLTYTMPAAYSLLPVAMRSDKATALLIAIGLHESGFTARRQLRGPAHGFWMCERGGGVKGVLTHPRTATPALAVFDALQYSRRPTDTIARVGSEVFEAITHNDVFACCVARLLLWTLPAPLPAPDDPADAFAQYLEAWRPGAYTRGTEAQRIEIRARFVQHYADAWARVTAAGPTP